MMQGTSALTVEQRWKEQIMNDLIKREDALYQLADWINSDEICYTNGLWKLEDRIKNIPSVEKQGEWIIHGESPLYVKECSACGSKFFHHAMEDLTPYCAECGARMLVAVSEEFKRFLEE